jgi:hypothetical protein
MVEHDADASVSPFVKLLNALSGEHEHFHADHSSSAKDHSMTIAYVCAHTLAKSASRQFAESTCWPRTSGDAGAFAGINPTITSGSPLIRADQRLLWRFGKLRAARVSALQSPRCCI